MPYTRLEQQTLRVAKQCLGYREETGRNDGWFPRLVQRWVARGATWLDNQPWCIMFVTWAVHRAASQIGVTPVIPRNASSSSLYAWAKKHQKLLPVPKPGCIGLVRRGGQGDQDGGSNAGKTHIHGFFVHSVTASGELVTVEGNFRNSVCWNKRRRPYNCDWMEIC